MNNPFILRHLCKYAVALSLSAVLSAPAYAIPSLFSWGFNIDGTVYDDLNSTPATLPTSINAAGFNFSTGIGTVNISVSGVGAHNVGGFFDHDISGVFNDFGATSGAAAAGQTWELDDPLLGDINANFLASLLDNTNAVSTSPNDVSMALANSFTLGMNQQALISFMLSSSQPNSGFYLSQIDADTGETVYFSSALTIRAVPEPAIALLIGAGFVGLLMGRARRHHCG